MSKKQKIILALGVLAFMLILLFARGKYVWVIAFLGMGAIAFFGSGADIFFDRFTNYFKNKRERNNCIKY